MLRDSMTERPDEMGLWLMGLFGFLLGIFAGVGLAIWIGRIL
jgi:hypothetical protein